MTATASITLQHDAPIRTWFGIGGRAARFVRPRSMDELRTLLADEPDSRILGDGANLLVDDAGVDELVVSLDQPGLAAINIDAKSGIVKAGAGAHLFRLINLTVEAGLQGLEVLAGVPARLGGAIVMNAGGSYGEIATSVVRVFALTRDGRDVTLDRRDIGFGYRRSGLADLIITGAELQLTPADPVALALHKREINEKKMASQPLCANSAGCCFKNPTLREGIKGAGDAGQRVSAGMLIDRAGLKGTRIGGAEVSKRHGNFIVVDKETATARDVIALMERVESGVLREFGIALDREVVVWSNR